jgi:hypothetical protein
MQTIFLYLDPGTGSMLVQAAIAGVLAFTMFIKNIKFQLAAFFATPKFQNLWVVQKMKAAYTTLYTRYVFFAKFVNLAKAAKFKLNSLL